MEASRRKPLQIPFLHQLQGETYFSTLGPPHPTYGKGKDRSRAVQSPISSLILTAWSHQGMNSAMRHLGSDLQDLNSKAEASELQALSESRYCTEQQPQEGSNGLEPPHCVLSAAQQGPVLPHFW